MTGHPAANAAPGPTPSEPSLLRTAAHPPRSIGALAAAAVALAAGSALAQGDVLFTVARGGPSNLRPDVVYRVVGGAPTQIGGGSGMGLSPADDIDGMSHVVIPGLRAGERFVICFGVDPFATGVSRFRIPLQNVFRQAENNQEAADAFLSTEAFERGVGILPPPFSMGLFNNALAINQSERYPNVFALLPGASPGRFVSPGVPLDDVNGTMLTGDLTPPALFFTLTRDSPALDTLPGVVSGATIILDPNFVAFGNEQLYANPVDLGLARADDIDALTVFDQDLNGRYNAGDTVYFSLTPDSPTLARLNLGPGDVLVSELGVVSLFASAGELGLKPTDNMDAMDTVPLRNDSAEDTINGIVPCPADFNGDGTVNTLDVLAFLNAWAAGDAAADHNGDGAVNTLDVLLFLNDFAGGC